MKRLIIYTFLFFMGTPYMHAQSLQFLQNCSPGNQPGNMQLAKTNAIKQRIIGGHSDNYLGGTWIPTDSVTLSYTGTRGVQLYLDFYNSDAFFPNLEFDVENYYHFDGTIWVKNFKYEQVFDANDLCTNSTFSLWDGAVFNFDSRVVNTYNADHTLASMENEEYVAGVWENVDITDYTYEDAALNDYITRSWTGIDYENYIKSIYVYDITTGLATTITTQVWSGGAWENNNRTIVDYNLLNQIVQETEQFWDGVSWVENTKYVYEYDVNDLLYTKSTYYGGTLDGRSIYTYDASLQLDQDLGQSYDIVEGYVNDYRTSYDFTEGSPSYIYNESWDGSTFVPVSRVNYYSESFDDGVTAVQNGHNSDFHCTVFPQPASDAVNFVVEGNTMGNVHIAIADMSGKIIMARDVNPANAMITLNKSDIPQNTGMYLWRITTSDGMQSNGKLLIQ